MDMSGRAYAFVEVKSIDEDERIIEGLASTPTPDRVGDIVNPMGAKFKLPLPLLWQHDHTQPIGQVDMAKPTKAGIPFKAKLAKTSEPGRLKDRLDEAWQSIKLKLVRAVSIGFRPIKYNFIENGGIEFDEWEWFELSAVTVPAQAEATINTIKSIDAQLRAGVGADELAKQFDTGAERQTNDVEDQDNDAAATGKMVPVVYLNDPARDRAKAQPYVIQRIIV